MKVDNPACIYYELKFPEYEDYLSKTKLYKVSKHIFKLTSQHVIDFEE